MLNLSLIQNSDVNNNNSSSNMIGRSGGVSRLSARSSQQLNMLVAKNHMNLSMGNHTAAANSSPSVMAAGNLSPSIMVNVENGSPSTISINNALTIRHPLLTTPSVVTAVTPASSSSVEPPPPPLVATTVPQQQQQQETSSSNSGTCLGDYVFFEAACPTDTFATALNIKNRQPYLWKKFERRDYMKKLEPYFVMEGTCDKIYRFADIMVKANYQQQQATTSSGSELLTDATVEDQDDSVYVVFEPHYGDLHSFMKEKKRLDEAEARAIFGQCVEAVQACHENGIIIRDIKLKKFVFLDPERTKIGLANLEDCLLLDEDAENDLIKNQQGCPAYVSPEVLNPFQTSYSGKLSDAWSLGIILYTLLVGRYPFHHPTIANMFARIARGKFQVPMPISLSLDARTLLRSLIRVKPEERLRPDEILAHNWFRQNETDWSSASSLRMTLTATVNSNKSHQHALVFSQPNQWSAVNPLVINKIGLSSSPLSSSSNDTHTATKDSSVDHSGRDDCCVPQLPE